MSTSVDVDEYFATENLINAIFTGLLQSATFYIYYKMNFNVLPSPAYLISDRLRIPDGAPAKLKFFCANFESYANLARKHLRQKP